MAGSGLVDAGGPIALRSRRERHHAWVITRVERVPPPWQACNAALSRAFHLLGQRGRPALAVLLGRGPVVPTLDLADKLDRVLGLVARLR
jgi:hypothetical protein